MLGLIRGLREGYVTNFYPDETKIGRWIQEESLYYVKNPKSVAFLKDCGDFQYLFYAATTENELSILLTSLTEKTLIADIVGHQADGRTTVFDRNGFRILSSLIRMARPVSTAQSGQYGERNPAVGFARPEDIPTIDSLLNAHFDRKTEQLPSKEELIDWTERNEILTYLKDEAIKGFIIFDKTPAVIHIRYWFVDPSCRNQGVGSALMNEVFHLGEVVRFIRLWVKETNLNARKRYEHYGFKEDGMKDTILIRYADSMEKKILEILAKVRPEFDFTEQVDFIEAGMIDSFDVVSLVTEMDAAFGISIDGMDIVPENFASLDAIVKMLQKNGAKA